MLFPNYESVYAIGAAGFWLMRGKNRVREQERRHLLAILNLQLMRRNLNIITGANERWRLRQARKRMNDLALSRPENAMGAQA